jgi:hypothetical protein
MPKGISGSQLQRSLMFVGQAIPMSISSVGAARCVTPNGARIYAAFRSTNISLLTELVYEHSKTFSSGNSDIFVGAKKENGHATVLEFSLTNKSSYCK